MDRVAVGDEVLVTLKGKVDRVLLNGFAIVGPQGTGQTVYTALGVFESVEVLPPPEKEWVDGDVVRSAAGGVFVRAHGGWWVAGHDDFFPHYHPARPLTELIPKDGG